MSALKECWLRPAYNHLGYSQDRPVNNENTEMRYMQDLTNHKPNANPNPLILPVALVRLVVWFVL